MSMGATMRWASAALAVGLLLGIGTAEAATYSFTGTVDDPGALGPQFQAGDTLHFLMTIDTSQTGTVFFGSTFYDGESLSGQFSNGYAFDFQPTVRVQPSANLVTFGGSTLGSASVGPYSPANLDFFFDAPVADGSLPNFIDLLPLSTSNTFHFHFTGPTDLGDSEVQGHLTAVTPIPPTLPLLVSALAGLGVAWRYRQRRNAATAARNSAT